VFEVRDSGGCLADTFATDSHGRAQSKPLPLKSYTLTEKTAPTGFVRNSAAFPVFPVCPTFRCLSR